jgi:hypothetical protein
MRGVLSGQRGPVAPGAFVADATHRTPGRG